VEDKKAHLHIRANFLEEITASVMEGFISRRIREDRIAPKTANRYREVLHRMFGYATKNWGLVPTDGIQIQPPQSNAGASLLTT